MSKLREEYSKFKSVLPGTSITYEQWLEQQIRELKEEKESAMEMLNNIFFWETCPEDYKDIIRLLNKP